ADVRDNRGNLFYPKRIIPYAAINDDTPFFPTSTVEGHEGALVIGALEDVPVIGLQGRKHYYEVAECLGNTGMLQVIFPVNVLAGLGVKNYFGTNAVGGLHRDHKVGDIMIVKDHINTIPNALLGRQHKFNTVDDEPTARFPPMTDAYDPEYQRMLRLASAQYMENTHQGVYCAFTGPSYETPAERRYARDVLKADTVGMSLAPEVLAARNRGMKCVAFNCITNIIDREGSCDDSHEEVIAVTEDPAVKKRLASTVQNFFSMYKEEFMDD
ncbi:purine-nucleoside phosphorylase, partial [Thermoproteota archaeon]